VSKRCVSRFDHYCPWIGNAVGEKNHKHFVIFLVLESIAMTIALVVAISRMSATGQSMKVLLAEHSGAFAFVVLDGTVLLSVSMLTCSQLGQVFSNLTTNEMINQHRYKYLQDKEGSFRNPYDKGCWPNTLEFFVGAEYAAGNATEAPLLQKDMDRSQHAMHKQLAAGLLHDRLSNGPTCGGAINALCSRLCGAGHHGHSHGPSGCCKNEDHRGKGASQSIRDIEEAYPSGGL